MKLTKQRIIHVSTWLYINTSKSIIVTLHSYASHNSHNIHSIFSFQIQKENTTAMYFNIGHRTLQYNNCIYLNVRTNMDITGFCWNFMFLLWRHILHSLWKSYIFKKLHQYDRQAVTQEVQSHMISTLQLNLLWNRLKSISNCPHITKFVLPTRHYKLNHHNIHLSFCNQYCDATFNSDFKQSWFKTSN